VYNNYSFIKEISRLQKNNPPLWKEAINSYFSFIKFTMVKTTVRNFHLPGTEDPCQAMNSAIRVHN